MNEVKPPRKEEYYLNFVQSIARSRRSLRLTFHRGGFMNESNPPITSYPDYSSATPCMTLDINATHCRANSLISIVYRLIICMVNIR